MDQAKESCCDRSGAPHHAIVASDISDMVRQIVHKGAVPVHRSLVVGVGEILIEQLVILFVIDQVLVNDSLLLIQISCQLVNDINLIMFVLDLA